MKTLFLTASFADVAEHLPAFIGEALTGKSVAFIPTANHQYITVRGTDIRTHPQAETP